MRENKVIRKAAYVMPGINEEGRKEVLSMTIGENKSAKFWLSVLNELKNRGINGYVFLVILGRSIMNPPTDQKHCRGDAGQSTKYLSLS